MSPFDRFVSRRSFFYGSLAIGSSLLFTRKGLFAEELAKTPRVTEGPFYPDKLPLDTDNDLLIINDNITPAVGEITHLTGRILDISGTPIKNATVEIWQVDNGGAYLHSGTGNKDKKDKNFQGFGRFSTGAKGEYYFRTIKPVSYPGRAPHIHVKVKHKGKEILCTQILIADHPENKGDGVFKSAGGILEREMLLAEFKPIKDSKIGELSANFDMVVGKTPEEKK